MAERDLAFHLKGFSPDMPTPFDAGGELDLSTFARLCQRHLGYGVGALVVATATGESPTLTRSERIALIRCAVEVTEGHAIVIAGATSNATAHACNLAQDAEAAGAAAILSGTPYYNKPTQSGIEAHFRAIAEASRLPIILHDEPGRSISAMADETVARLAELPAIVGLCDASGDVSRLTRLRGSLGQEMLLLSGNDSTSPALIATGGDGCISGAYNVVPRLCHAFYDHVVSGEITKARRLAIELAGLIAALSSEAYPSPLKCALASLGQMSGTMRLPMVGVPTATQGTIKAALEALSGWISRDAVPYGGTVVATG